MIYLDNNATTPMVPEVFEAMRPYMTECYGNPSSAYRMGARARDAVEGARAQVASLIGASPGEIVFTSGGTESDNAAIGSALRIDPDRRLLVISEVEHSAVLRHAEQLARTGVAVVRVPVGPQGALDLQRLDDVLSGEAAMVSIMWANNETGVLFPIDRIARSVRSRGVLFHTDAVQAVGKISIDVLEEPVDFLSLSAHKFHGPKGVGALYVRSGRRFNPLIVGGGQQEGRRGGTENVAGIVGMGKAAELAAERLSAGVFREVAGLRDHFESRLLAEIVGVTIHGRSSLRLPNTSNLSIEGTDAEGILVLLDKAGVCASAGSACTSGSLQPSHVLEAMGVPARQAAGSLRFSFGPQNTIGETDRAVEALKEAAGKLRSLRSASPVVFAGD